MGKDDEQMKRVTGQLWRAVALVCATFSRLSTTTDKIVESARAFEQYIKEDSNG